MTSEAKPRRMEGEQLLRYALRALGRRAYSIGELREKLRQRAVSDDEAEDVLRRLRALGYLDDRKLAESYAAARLENEGLGRIRVVRELRRRKVAPQLAERVVARVYAGTDEHRLVEDFLRRKYRGKPLEELLSEPKGVASLYRRLRSAGFTHAGITAVLRRLAPDPDLLVPLEEDSPE
ncbi:MAG: regulatory protein RecX [Bryobacterales bacterium]|nr:recombination regulator RecX [Bryobacteraceae bacterium]MDW8129815.1 regulatory protein RecX [Bryobacterales bacterium]